MIMMPDRCGATATNPVLALGHSRNSSASTSAERRQQRQHDADKGQDILLLLLLLLAVVLVGCDRVLVDITWWSLRLNTLIYTRLKLINCKTLFIAAQR